MRSCARVAAGLAALAIGLSAPASALEAVIPPDTGGYSFEAAAIDDFRNGGIFDEVRLGASRFTGNGEPEQEDGVFVTGQILFDPLWGSFNNYWLDAFLRPRPHLGGSVSIGDGTDQIFGGVTWTFPIYNRLFVEASFGGTIHDGPDHADHDVDELSLGCSVLFRESVGAGIYLGPHWRVMAGVDHSSHANLCGSDNDGLTHYGGSLGYRF